MHTYSLNAYYMLQIIIILIVGLFADVVVVVDVVV